MQAFLVPPGDPLEGGLFERLHAVEWFAAFDQLALVRAVDGFRQRVVVRVADAARGGEDAVLVQARAVDRADVLGAVIRVVDQTLRVPMQDRPRDGLVQGDQGKLARALASGDCPAHDPSVIRVGDERHIGEAPVGQAHVRDVRRVQATRGVGRERPVHQILASSRAPGGQRGDRDPAAAHAPDAQLTHHVQHLVTPDALPALTLQLGEYLPVPVDRLEPVGVDHVDVTGQRLVTRPHHTGGTTLGLPVGSGGDETAVQRRFERAADRPNPEPCAIRVHVCDHQRRVGSSLEAKKPTPNSKSRSPDAVPRPPCAVASIQQTPAGLRRPGRPPECASGAATPWKPPRSPATPTSACVSDE